ncbi:MAG: threonine/serine exporter family protein [Clostridiales bacterium]|nr:threonine/serine exporter family protein [Clostridiales bacterium]
MNRKMKKLCNSSDGMNCYTSSPLKFAFGEGLDVYMLQVSYDLRSKCADLSELLRSFTLQFHFILITAFFYGKNIVECKQIWERLQWKIKRVGIAKMEQITDYKLLLDTAVLAGQIMLRNGAEIYRVEDTIHRILKVSSLKTTEAYVTTTGMIVTLDDPQIDSLTVIRRIADRETNLNKITLVNTISRRFCAGEITLKEAFHDLKHLESREYSQRVLDISTIIVASAFALLLGGTAMDALGAAIDGALLVLVLKLGIKIGFNPFFKDVAASAVIAVGAILLSRIPFAVMNMDMIIIGTIMPLVPGAAITNAIRDTLQGDYVAGGAKALEAFVKAVAIVIGVAFGMLIMGGVKA